MFGIGRCQYRMSVQQYEDAGRGRPVWRTSCRGEYIILAAACSKV